MTERFGSDYDRSAAGMDFDDRIRERVASIGSRIAEEGPGAILDEIEELVPEPVRQQVSNFPIIAVILGTGAIPSPFVLPVSALAAMVAGALVLLGPVLLKTRLGVDEVDPGYGLPLGAGGLAEGLEVERPERAIGETVEPDHFASCRTGCRGDRATRALSSRSS